MVSIVAWVVSSYLMAGLMHTALKQMRGETIAVSDLFAGGYAFLPVLGASFLSSLAAGIGFLLCLLPGIFLTPLFLLILPILVDQRVGAMDGISRSFDLVKQNYWLFFVYVMVFGAIVTAASAVLGQIPGVGLLLSIVTTPLMMLAMVVPYFEIFYPGAQAMLSPQAPMQAYAPPPYAPPPAAPEPPPTTPETLPNDEPRP